MDLFCTLEIPCRSCVKRYSSWYKNEKLYVLSPKIGMSTDLEKKQIRTTFMEMFQQRNYSSIEETEDMITAEEENEDKVCVFLTVKNKFNVEDFKSHMNQLAEMEIKHGIVVYNDITAPTKKLISDTSEFKIELEEFQANSVLYNITKHRLARPHVRLTDKKEILDLKRNYDLSKFPILRQNDAMAKFYGFKKGDIVKIIRKNGYVSYRVVRK